MTPASGWERFSTALISDCMDRFGTLSPEVRLLSGRRLAGPAFPVEIMEGESGTLHRAVLRAPAGSVLVVEGQGLRTRAVWGEILTAAALGRGIAGLVLNGMVRDLEAIRERDFPLFAIGTSPAGPHKGWDGRIGDPVACAGVVVHAGDVVVGDRDGVVIVPQSHAPEIEKLVTDRMQLEEEWLARVDKGESTLEVLGIGEE